MPVTFICRNCGKSVTTSPSRPQEFCSLACRKASFRVQQVCVICGKMYEAVPSRAKEQVTCRSKECIAAFIADGKRRSNYGERRYTFTCLHCGKTVSASVANRQYCSQKCNYAHKRAQKVCTICGKVFEDSRTRVSTLATCGSEECKRAMHYGEHNPFYGHHHSKESIEVMRRKKLTPRMEASCTCGCGEKVTITRWRQKKNKTNVFFVDQSHLLLWLKGENHWNYRGGNIYYGDEWTKTARAVRERDKVCQQCGKTPEQNGRALDVHHINPARISGDNSMENLIALCMSCHHRINVFEQYQYPHKRGKYRKCLVCNKIFIPLPFQNFCSDECKRKRKRRYEKKYRDTHPHYVQHRRQKVKHWQQKNKDRVNSLHQQSRLRRKRAQVQSGPGLFD